MAGRGGGEKKSERVGRKTKIEWGEAERNRSIVVLYGYYSYERA